MNKNKKRVYRNKKLKEFFATLMMGVVGEMMTILGLVSLVSTFLIKLLGPRPFFMWGNPEGSIGSLFWSMMILSDFIVVFGIVLLCRAITIEKRSEKKEESETEKEDKVEEKDETREDEMEEKSETIEDEEKSPVRDMEQEIEEKEEIKKEQKEDEEDEEEKTEEDVEEIKNCPVCGTNVSPDDKKCPLCDEPLRQMDEV